MHVAGEGERGVPPACTLLSIALLLPQSNAVLCMRREKESEEEYRMRVRKARGEINRRLIMLIHALVQVGCGCL